MRFVILGAALLFLGVGARLEATIYYVDYKDGNDANRGLSTSSAWQHCPGDPAADGAPAECVLNPGDTVYFKGGVTYLFTGANAIALKWDGASAAPITYDGNSANTWGSGRATLTSNHGGTALAAFGADSPRHDLAFRSLEISAIGGAATLPSDLGEPIPRRYGAGIAFRGGAMDVLITGCVFSELGYWFNQRPMDASSIAGAGIMGGSACRGLTIDGCVFSRMADGCDLSHATELVQVKITNCHFEDSVAWPIDLPPHASGVSAEDIAIQGCTESNNAQFDPGIWSGYGIGPRVAVSISQVGGEIAFSVSATASPAATFQWEKNGQPIAGATAATLTLSNLTLLDTAVYTALATNPAGSALSNSIVLAVTPSISGSTTVAHTTSPDTSTTPAAATPVSTVQPTSPESGIVSPSAPLANVLLSTNAVMGPVPLSLSFTVQATTTKRVLIRALGPALAPLGVGGTLSDPKLDLYREGVRIAENDNWAGSDALRDVFARVGALPIGDPNSKDSALLMWLPTGNYTAVVSGVAETTGLSLAEAYEVP